MEEKGEHVGGGTFRVDRAAALEKLKKHQLADPWHFVRAWARAASLSGPTRVDCFQAGEASVLRFDGEPLPAGFLDAPYDAMFNGDLSAPSRHAAIGILGAMRLNPAGIEVRSGGRRWSWSAAGEESGDAATSGTTELSVRWSGPEGKAHHGLFEHMLREACGMLRVFVSIGPSHSTPFDVRRLAQSARSVRTERRQAVFCPAPARLGGEVVLYRDGVRAGEGVYPGFELLSVHLNDDDFELDLSGCEVRQDDRLREALKDAERSAEELFPRATRVQGGLPGELPRYLATPILGGLSVGAVLVSRYAFAGGGGRVRHGLGGLRRGLGGAGLSGRHA